VPVATNQKDIDYLIGRAKAAVARDPKTRDEALKRLQQRLPKGVDARLLLEQ